MADFPIKGGVAVITGAASGIGAALAADLAAKGCHLALCDRNAEGLARTAAAARLNGVNVSEHVLDVADAAAIAALPDAVLAVHGRVTILVNNAGVALAGTFMEATLEDFAWLMDINFWGPVRLCRAFMFALTQEPTAHIVNISSIFGVVAPPGQTAYCAAKFGVRGFSESLRHELAGTNLSLTVVHPGGVRTEIARSARIPQGIDPVEAAKQAEEATQTALVMPPSEAASLIAGAIAKRAPRLLIGRDARMLERIQRLFPVTYWRRMQMLMGRLNKLSSPGPVAP